MRFTKKNISGNLRYRHRRTGGRRPRKTTTSTNKTCLYKYKCTKRRGKKQSCVYTYICPPPKSKY